MMEKLLYKIEVFEGPLDLLLHLITKHKLDIQDIPILELVTQYTDYVRRMRDADLEVASEFIEMAARLVYIKTVSLLPVYEEAEELKKELAGELMEYRDAKRMAERLAEQTEGFERVVRGPMKLEFDMTYERIHEPFELSVSYLNAVGKKLRRLPPPMEAFAPIVSRTIVAVVDKIDSIVTALRRKKRQRLGRIFTSAASRSELVASFLAVLELVKNKQAVVEGEGEQSELVLCEGDASIEISLEA
ncbi:MAG: segregation/condensation protein A [Oscillospiraceae bacterium]|jgi:segregation and condensation protein A|nr:segregation/condensation protein A [Oscillospiraceae bacterium]